MRLINSVVALASGASLALADTHIYDTTDGLVGGVPRQYMYNESNLNDLHSPNVTNSVKFTFGREEWTWRVNVTSLSVPDARLDLDSINGPPLPDPRVIMTTYDLQWPNSTATLNETVIRIDEQFSAGGQTSRNSSTYAPLCMAVITSPLWPNITNKLKDNQDGDCNAVLGPECVTALLAPPWSGGGCGLPNYRVDACRDTFGPNGYPVITGASISRGNWGGDGLSFNYSHVELRYAGESVWFGSSVASAEPNTTALRQAESQLRVMFLSLPSDRVAVCTRVDPSIDDVEVSPISQNADWDGNKSSGSGDGGDGSSAAGPRLAATFGSVGLAVVAFGLLL